jgi:hypothetical protein
MDVTPSGATLVGTPTWRLLESMAIRRPTRMDWARLASAGIVVACLVAGWAGTASADVPTSCADADTLLQAATDQAALQAADSAYVQLLDSDPNLTCAAAGHHAAADLVAALALQEAGRKSDVPGLVVDAVKARPQTAIPTALKALLPSPTAPPAHVSPWQMEGWLTWQDRVVVVLLAALSLLLLCGLVRGLVRQALGGSLQITPFTCSDTNVGAGFATVVGDHMTRLSANAGRQPPDEVTRFGDPVTISAALSGIVPQAAVVDAIVGLATRFLPNRSRVLGGLLHMGQSGVAGASGTLADRQNRIAASQTVWPGDFGLSPAESERRYPLAYPVAVWAFWQRSGHAQRLGSRDWRSYAHFGIGQALEECGEPDRAKQCYLRALTIDSRNRPALVNLASRLLAEQPLDGPATPAPAGTVADPAELIDLRAPHDSALRMLGWVSCKSVNARVRTARWLPFWLRIGLREPDSFWYRAEYLIASDAARPQVAALPAAGSAAVGAGKQAEERAGGVAVRIEEALSRVRLGRDGRAFRSFLQDLEVSALVLWARVRLLEGGSPRVAKAKKLRDLTKLSGRRLHRLLGRSIERHSLSPAAVVWLCERKLRLTPHARYNIACYHAVAARLARPPGVVDLHARRALHHLGIGVRELPTAMIQWAQTDPCFEDLRASRRYRDDFDRVLQSTP